MGEVHAVTNILLILIVVGIWVLWRALVDILASLSRIEERMGTSLYKD
jgi:hypothetical protein